MVDIERETWEMGDGIYLAYLPDGRWEIGKSHGISQAGDGRWKKSFKKNIYLLALNTTRLSHKTPTQPSLLQGGVIREAGSVPFWYKEGGRQNAYMS